MKKLTLNRYINEFLKTVFTKSEGGVVTGDFILFDKPITQQSTTIDKNASNVNSFLSNNIYDKKSRTTDDLIAYTQYQTTQGTSPEGKTNSNLIRSRTFIGIPNNNGFNELCRYTSFDDGSSVLSTPYIGPLSNNKYAIGSASAKYTEVFASTGTINTSDIREKQQIESYPDEVLDAWSEVELRQFLFNDAVEKKGDSARIHSGMIAQQIVEVFKKHGLDATKYGLLCYDEWEDEYEDVEIIDAEAIYDENGNEISPVIKHTEKKLVTPAGNRYGIRYSEALCLEAAYQRRENEKLKNELSNLQARLNTIESKLGIK